MNILLLGANGAIGVHVLNKALSNGDKVVALVRRKESLTQKHKNLMVHVGNIDNTNLLDSLIAQVDVVISTLGPPMDMARKVKSTPIADAHQLILKSMQKHGKKRFVTIGTPTVQAKEDVKHFSNVVLPLIPRILFPTGYQEYRKMGRIMSQSDLDWTVVRFLDPNSKHDNQEIEVNHEGKARKVKISRKDIASFTYKIALENSFLRKMPMIFHKN